MTYWGYQYSLPYIRKAAALPPLGLATLAALLPREWETRIADLNIEPLSDDALRWADAVLVSGMLVQSASMRETLSRARALGKRTVAGGAGPTTSPDAYPEADHVFCGEAEGRLEPLVRALEDPRRLAPRLLSPAGEARPDVTRSPVPRFDLLDLSRYASLSIQVSRGCPFSCEFCDIIEIFGRVPRVKSAEQVVRELETLRALGGRGPLFFVDDNFIGNRKAVSRILPHVADWQRRHGRPFDLYTEASVNLATETELVDSMIAAGFSAVFLGIETPSDEALRETGKKQNLIMDPSEAVSRLTEAGLEVFAGFIVGFDADGEDIFDRQRDFIQNLAIPRAMVGLLSALPGTALWRRLEKEGRLRRDSNGDQFGRPNFATAMDEATLLAGYRRLLGDLYAPEAYYARCARYLEQTRLVRAPLRRGSLAALLRALWGIGLAGPRRRHFWRLLGGSLKRGPVAVARAVTLAILGESLIRYTEEVVLPRIERTLAELPTPRPAVAGGGISRAVAASSS
jgi:radical SAM superfamily enzyme YgiQ (UPF0313 family)